MEGLQELTNALSNGTNHPRPLWPPLPRDWSLQLSYRLLSQEWVKLQTSNVGNSSHRHSQGVPKIFRAPMYRAHCTVIFAIVQVSCLIAYCTQVSKPCRQPRSINCMIGCENTSLYCSTLHGSGQKVIVTLCSLWTIVHHIVIRCGSDNTYAKVVFRLLAFVQSHYNYT